MLGFRIACRGKLFMRGMRGEMRMRGQIGLDLFVFDDAILFGVCKYVQRKVQYVPSPSSLPRI